MDLKKIVIIAGFVLIGGLVFLLFYNINRDLKEEELAEYYIKADMSNIKDAIVEHEKLGKLENYEPVIEVHDYIEIDDMRYVMYEQVNDLGVFKIKKGENGNYKPNGAGKTNCHFKLGVEEINNKKYFIILGANREDKIASIKADIFDYSYNITIPEGIRFITYVEVDSSIDVYDSFKETTLTFYNDDGEDISKEFEVSYSGI